MWPIEDIPENSLVYRLISKGQIGKKTRLPSENMFSPDEDGLSVDWDRHTTPEDSLITVGRTYKYGKTEYKDPSNFLVFRLKVLDIIDLREDLAVNHTPVFNDPEIQGLPNNRSHSSVIGYNDQDEEIRIKLRDLAEQIPESNINMEYVLREVDERRNS